MESWALLIDSTILSLGGCAIPHWLFHFNATTSKRHGTNRQFASPISDIRHWRKVTAIRSKLSIYKAAANAAGHLMELRQLRYFVRIVDMGSLSRAAGVL